MKTAAMIAMSILAGSAARAGENHEMEGPEVVICGQWKSDMNTYRAQRMAARMFADIGVTIQFLFNPRTCPAGAIQIRLTGDTPDDLLPGALAYAQPYEGVHIQVFYDRIRARVPAPGVPSLLAHVLVHEITHILQGVSRHSASGLMKAHWDGRDYTEMGRKPLEFTDEDIRLIRQALDARVAQPLEPRNTEMAKITAQ